MSATVAPPFRASSSSGPARERAINDQTRSPVGSELRRCPPIGEVPRSGVERTQAPELTVEQLTRELDEARAELQTRTEERDESRRQQAATADVLKVISSSRFDLQAVFDTLVDLATRLCRADKATILRLDNDHFTLVASYGMPADFREYVQANPLGLDRGSVSARAALEGQAVHVADVLADAEFAHHESQKRGGFRTALAVPLMREGFPIGSIFLTRAAIDPFTQQQIDLANTFADQAVIALENARLFDEVQARTRELSAALDQQTATSEVLQVISRAKFHLQPVLDTLVELAARLCEAESAFVYRRDGDVYHVAANHGFSEEYVHFITENPIPPGRELCVGRTALTAGIVHMPDCLADPEYNWNELQRIGGFRTMLGVPLLREGVPVGVIALTRARVQPFTQKQIELVTTFADQAVIAIENVRLFEEVQARTSGVERSPRIPVGHERRAERDQQNAIRFGAGVRRDCADRGAALRCAILPRVPIRWATNSFCGVAWTVTGSERRHER